MKIKLRNIIEGLDGLNALLALKLPMPVAFNLARTAAEFQPHINAFNAAKQPLLTGLDMTDAETVRMAQAELDATLDIDVEIRTEKLNIADIGTAEMEPGKLVNILWLFEEGAGR